MCKTVTMAIIRVVRERMMLTSRANRVPVRLSNLAEIGGGSPEQLSRIEHAATDP